MSFFYLFPDILDSQLIILIIALFFDLVIGEPPEKIHPTVIIGKTIEHLSKITQLHKRLYGILLALTIISTSTGISFLIMEIARTNLNQIVFFVLGGFLLKISFAIKSLKQHIHPIKEALQKYDLQSARVALSKIVRRETRDLDEGLCASAAIESIAEGTVDGIISPLFYFFLFGVPGAIAFRAINTLDSMIGYRNNTYATIGWFSAKLDTIANYVPARLTGLIMILASAIVGRNLRLALLTLKKEHNLTESVNAGWPMSAMAGVIGVQLQKKDSYKLGDNFRSPNYRDISPAFQIMKFTIVIFLIAATAIDFTIINLLLR